MVVFKGVLKDYLTGISTKKSYSTHIEYYFGTNEYYCVLFGTLRVYFEYYCVLSGIPGYTLTTHIGYYLGTNEYYWVPHPGLFKSKKRAYSTTDSLVVPHRSAEVA